MWKKLIPGTIRGKIMAITALITLLITILTTTVCFSVFQSFLRKNQIQATEFSLQVVSSNITQDMNDIIYFSKWCGSNRDIIQFLEGYQDEPKIPIASNDTDNLRPLALSTYDRLKEEYYHTRAYEYISRVIVTTGKGNTYLQVAPLANYSNTMASKIVAESSFFSQLYESRDYLWIGLVNEPFSKVNPQLIIPVVRPVYNEFNSEIIGWSYVEIPSDIVTDYFASYPLAEDSQLFFTQGGYTYGIRKNGLEKLDTPYTNPERITKDTFLSKGTELYNITMENGSTRVLVRRPVESMDGWYLSQILSEEQFAQQKQLYLLLILAICGVIISLGIILMFTLTRIIVEPIKKLCGQIDNISEGNFVRAPEIEWNHELGQVGRGINNMSDNIVTLMNKRVSDEKQKKDLEYQILQSQINPHFLYNTLNSIKWMATIQNATGIADMTTALARLLKSVSKGTGSMVPLREELALIKDYFLIQQYRYGGSVSIEYHILSEDLYDCQIHRFTLQPIIENALFHGIEPKGTAGLITVTAEAVDSPDGKLLKISITDDGVGMTEDMIREVLREDATEQNKTEFFRHVGIGNVNKRIQHDFGPEYGITIESQPGVYTTMTIIRPYIIMENE